MIRIGILVFMLTAGICDLKTGKLNIFLLAAGGAVSVAALAAGDGGFLEGLALGLIPSLVFLICGAVSRGGVGLGDTAVVGILGVSMGLYSCLMSTGIALLGAGVFSAVLMARRRLNKNTRIPFVPFLAAGYLAAEAVARFG